MKDHGIGSAYSHQERVDPIRRDTAADFRLEATDRHSAVEHTRRKNAAVFLLRHRLTERYTIDDLLDRIQEMGEEIAAAEARAGTMPRRAAHVDAPHVGGDAITSEPSGRSSSGTSDQDIRSQGTVIRPTTAASPRRESPRNSELLQSPEGVDDGEW